MAVKSTQRGPLRAVFQHGFDTVVDLTGLVAGRISAAADPRARQLRRRRRALRWAWIFTAGSAFWALVTAILAAWGWFALLLQITGAIAVIEVIPATLDFAFSLLTEGTALDGTELHIAQVEGKELSVDALRLYDDREHREQISTGLSRLAPRPPARRRR